jgi:benzil reductase ((S)-benzoin forming)
MLKHKYLISGVGTGIGLELGRILLNDGDVYGISRTYPSDLAGAPNFSHLKLDFSNDEEIATRLDEFIQTNKIEKLKYLFLNVGQFSQRIAPMSSIPIDNLIELMRINVWSHKHVLDALLRNHCSMQNVVISSSIAGVRARAGNSGYAITKAALNMLAKIYALENPEINFYLLGLCSVDTRLSYTIGNLPLEGNFPEIEALRAKALTSSHYLTSPQNRALDIINIIKNSENLGIVSGNFYEVRELLQNLYIEK